MLLLGEKSPENGLPPSDVQEFIDSLESLTNQHGAMELKEQLNKVNVLKRQDSLEIHAPLPPDMAELLGSHPPETNATL